MQFAVFSRRSWWEALRRRGLEPIVLPQEPPAEESDAGALQPRLLPRLRRGARCAQEFLSNPPAVDLLLDRDAEGLLLTRRPRRAAETYLPLHEFLGIPLFSHIQRPIVSALREMTWGQVWTCLGSRSWFKAFSDASHARELERFGVPRVMTLAAAAPPAEYPTDPLPPEPTEGVIGCVIRDHGPFFNEEHILNTAQLQNGVLTQWVLADQPGLSFFEAYFDLYGLDDPPQRSDSSATRAAKAARYYLAKRYYTAQMGLNHHARFVRFLRMRMRDRLTLWSEPEFADPLDPATGARRRRAYRSVAINLGFNVHRQEHAPDETLFEIAASGGFLLAHHSTGIARFLTPGEECDVFHHEQDLLEKIAHYLAHPHKRIAVAAAGQRRVLASHLHEHRLDELLRVWPQLASKLGAAFAEKIDENSSIGLTLDVTDEKARSEAEGAVAHLSDLDAANSAPSEKMASTAEKTAQTDKERIGEATGPVEETPASDPYGSAWVSTLSADREDRPTPGKGSLLILQNPGRVSRFYLMGLQNAARELGLDVKVVEMGAIWSRPDVPQERIVRRMVEIVQEHRVAAVLGYAFNGVFDLPLIRMEDGATRGLLAQLNVPHLMLWTDHPHWAHERQALRRDYQPFLRCPNQFHFVKSRVASEEIARFLKWPHVVDLPVAEDPTLLRPAEDVEEDFDLVVVSGAPPYLPDSLAPFVDQDDPDLEAVHGVVATLAREKLHAVWTGAPEAIRPKLQALGDDWIEAKRRDPLRPAYRHFQSVAPAHADAAHWLDEHYEIYFDALSALWEFGRWQRTFFVLYLARFHRVSVFGHDWSGMGVGGDPAWVDYLDQPRVYGRGRVCMNISQCNDEEGLSHKPFQIAACGRPLMHVERLGVAEHFEPGTEIELFQTPQQAREMLGELLVDDSRRRAMGRSLLERFRRDHVWTVRLPSMLTAAGLTPETFGLPAWARPAPAEPAMSH